MHIDGDRLKELREAKGVSQARLAADLEVHQDSVTRWEKGGTTTMKMLGELADYFEVAPSELMVWEKAA